jgi:hypothetical protein
LRNYLAFVFVFLLALPSGAQQKIRVELSERMVDDKINQSLAVLPIYIFVGINIEPFTMFGVEKAEQEDLVIQKMPNMSGMIDTAYTYIYFSGANTEINQGYCLTLVGNYRRSRRTIFFFIDRNNNLDFTDDGAPDSMTMMQHNTILKLRNVANQEAEHWIKISRFKYGENVKYKVLLRDHFVKHSGKKKFSNINYCFREQRLNTLGGTYVSGNDSFILALKDMNNDGIFNESCMDKIYLGSVNDEVNTDEMSYVLPNYDNIYFEWNRKRYRVVNLDPAGQFADIIEVENAVLTKQLETGNKVPIFSFINMKNEKEEIKSYKKKPVYIFFWEKSKITKEDTMYVRMIHEEFSEHIKVITLNHGDPPRSVRIIQYYDGVKWPMAFSSYQIGKIFFLEDLPKGYYLGKKLKLIDDDMSPKEMYDLLKTNRS